MVTFVITFLVIGGICLIGFLKNHPSSSPAPPPLRDLSIASDRELESIWVELKRSILVTDAHTDELLYQHLYDQVGRVLRVILARHDKFCVKVEASESLGRYVRDYADGALTYFDHALAFHELENELVLTLCMYSWTGRTLASGRKILANLGFTIRGLDFLINERKYAPAIFLKGLILKYGGNVYTAPNLDLADKYLTLAAENGVNSAKTELLYLSLHQSLRGVQAVHTGDPIWLS